MRGCFHHLEILEFDGCRNFYKLCLFKFHLQSKETVQLMKLIKVERLQLVLLVIMRSNWKGFKLLIEHLH
jgi:hypothetical protein